MSLSENKLLKVLWGLLSFPSRFLHPKLLRMTLKWGHPGIISVQLPAPCKERAGSTVAREIYRTWGKQCAFQENTCVSQCLQCVTVLSGRQIQYSSSSKIAIGVCCGVNAPFFRRGNASRPPLRWYSLVASHLWRPEEVIVYIWYVEIKLFTYVNST